MYEFRLDFKRTAALLLLVAFVVAGCAGQKLHRQGMSLMEEGRLEEGVAKLEQASKAEPDNLSYRNAWLRNREQTASRLWTLANSERAAGNVDMAQAIFERMLKLDPENGRARMGLQELAQDKRHEEILQEARRLFKKGDAEAAQTVLKPVFLENPKHGQALQLQRQIDEMLAKELMAGPALKAKFKKPVTLQFRDASVKLVFEALSRTSEINVLLDKDVKPEIKTSIFVKDVSVEDAIDLILLQCQLEKKIISDNTVFIYPKTPVKIKEFQDLKVRSFHLTNADPKQMQTMLKTLLKTKDIFVHEKTNSLVMRDTPEAIRLAEKMVADQDIADPEVMLEVEVLEISRSRLSEIGLKFPDQLTLTAQGATPNTGLTLNELRHFKAGNLMTSPAMAITLNLLLQDGETNLLASPRIRARNREKAKIMIGDRVPVITNAVTPVSTGSPVITGNVQYLDVGLKLEVEPEIHMDNEVSIKIALEVSSLVREVSNAVSGTLAYQVGTRNTSTVLRLKDGETQILAGLISDEDRNSANKVPGLGQLPVLGHLFSNHRDNGSKTEIVLSITPRIVGNNRYPDAREVEYWSGTEATLRGTPLAMKPLGTVSVSNTGSAPAAAIPVQPKPPAAPELLFSWQGPGEAGKGDMISVTLDVHGAQEMNSLGLLVGFDPAVLKAVDVVAGDFVRPGDPATNFANTIDQTGGQILIDVKEAATGGEGNVVTLVFEVLAAATQTQIAVTPVNPVGANERALPFRAPPHMIAVAP